MSEEYVIYRTGFPNKSLEYIKGSDWDNYVLDRDWETTHE